MSLLSPAPQNEQANTGKVQSSQAEEVANKNSKFTALSNFHPDWPIRDWPICQSGCSGEQIMDPNPPKFRH